MNYFALALLLVLFGAGCMRTPITATPPSSKQAEATLQRASLLDGPEAVSTDAQTGRRFVSVLPPTFRDENGIYTTQTPGEEIRVQIAVGGTPTRDTESFLAIPSLELLRTDTLGDWTIVEVADARANRILVRATQADAHDPSMYHVIECISTTRSTQSFWDGCRTMINAARIEQSTQQPR